jgi:hypothetical protein
MIERPIPSWRTLMGQESKDRRGSASAGAGGLLWFGGWLFTIGFAKLVWWKVMVGIVVWPYFLGLQIR